MSIILYGVTSGGTSVPIEVTEEGKLVVDTTNFPTDEFIKQGDDIEAGSITADGSITATDTLKAGTDNFFEWRPTFGVGQLSTTSSNADQALLYGESQVGGSKIDAFKITCGGSITAAGQIVSRGDLIVNANPGGSEYIQLTNDGSAVFAGGDITFSIDGSIAAAAGKCGFLSNGELIFWSRNVRYRAVVQGGNVMAEEYTRATELREKAEKLREPKTQEEKSAKLRKLKTQDIVSED